jgi:hypothetical protein
LCHKVLCISKHLYDHKHKTPGECPDDFCKWVGNVGYAIESVCWQTLKNFELWIIGDERNEDLKQLLTFFRHDSRIRSCHVKPGSNLHGFEGLRRARAEYVAYISPGHIWLPEHLQELTDHLDNTKADVVLSMMQAVYSGSRSALVVPELPDLPVTPEATVVMHRRNVMDRLKMVEAGMEFVQYSRYFLCQAKRKKMQIEVVPALTAVKFPGLNILAGTLPQQRYIERVKRDPYYLRRELSSMLINYDQQFRRFPAPYRLYCIVKRCLRGWSAKIGIEERWRLSISIAFKRKSTEKTLDGLTDSFVTMEPTVRKPLH